VDEEKKNESFPEKEETLAYVFHGGTIMAIMSFLQHAQEKDYYKYQCRNGEGYVCHLVISDEDSVTCKRHRKISL
jgi:alpha-ribazole phosphatase